MYACIVIGAGPSGLACTKELIEQGAQDVLCLEAGPDIGGVFRTGYDNLTLTSSAPFSIFSDYWCGDQHVDHFWSKEEALDYWRGYATHYGVLDKIRFNAKVASVSDDGADGWIITLDNGETLQTHRLALAIGNNSLPTFPEWARQMTAIDLVHSHGYRNAEPFEGKRVVVVGGGESGSDIALAVARVAETCWVSLRESTGWVVARKRDGRASDTDTHRGIWGLPREYGPAITKHFIKLQRERNDPVYDAVAMLNERVSARNGIWGTYGTKTLALPQAIAHHGAQVVGGVSEVFDGGRRIVTTDGHVLENVDAVICCTGFKNRVDFMPADLQSCDPRSLYKHMFHPQLGSRIGWIGWARPGFGSQFPLAEMQARLFALVATGQHNIPSAVEMERIAAADRARFLSQFEHSAQRIRSLVDYHHFIDDLAGLIGCTPPLREYFWRNPRMWLQIVYGPTQASQFRLRGPGAKPELAHQILKALPIGRLDSHVIRAGLVGRLRYLFKGVLPKFPVQSTTVISRA
jgi:dimethylaniline monooxygenase (N-oxide forming)